MSQKKHTTKADEVERVAEQVGDVMAEASQHAIEALQQELALLKEQLTEMTASRDELRRLLAQERDRRVVSEPALVSASGALARIITELYDVAVGGSAARLRLTVAACGRDLNRDERQTLREYAARLRAASEAVEQEAAALLL